MVAKRLNQRAFEKLAVRFRALGEVSRLKIVAELQAGELSVNQLVERTGLNQPNVSRHLLVLAQAALIDRRKEGTTIYYRIIDDTLISVCNLVCKNINL